MCRLYSTASDQSFVMRYAIISDIHANLAALKTVLTDIADMKADQIICLGDVSGYGPNPVDTLESVYGVVQVTLMGNHDAAVCGKINPDTFSPRAKTAVLRHREQLSQACLDWLKTLPLVFEGPGFRCAHGDFSNPAAFHYIIAPETALPSWSVTQEQLLFVGHSHMPGVYVIGSSGVPHFVPPCDFELEEGKRYIVNPGTVGYPRAGECRSSYCLFDTEANSITFRKLPFDCDGYQKALKEAGLGDDPWVQRDDAQRSVPSLRDHLSFAKQAPAADQHVQDFQEHGTLNARRTSRAPLLLLGLALCATLAAGGYAWHVHRSAGQAPLAVAIPDYELPMIDAYPLTPPDKNLLPRFPDGIGADGRLQGWRYAFEDRTRQRFSTGLRNGTLTLKIAHADTCRARLETPLIRLAGTRLQSLRLSGRLRKSEPFAGTVFYQFITYTSKPDGTPALGATQCFEMRDGKNKKTPMAAVNRKLAIGKNVTHVRFRIEASFAGTLEIEQPTLSVEPSKPPAQKETEK